MAPPAALVRGKGPLVTGLTLASMTELHPGCLHLLVRAEHAEQVTRTGSGTPPADNLYQLLLGVREMLPPSLAPAFIGRATEGPLTGLMVYDAFQEPRSAGLLLERLRHPGAAGPLRFERDPQVTVPAGLTPRVLDAEQSNTSLVYGDSYILKVFRRVQAKRQPGSGGAAGARPAGLHPRAGTRGLVPYVAAPAGDTRRPPAVPARRGRRLDPRAPVPLLRQGLHRRGVRTGTGDRRGPSRADRGLPRRRT